MTVGNEQVQDEHTEAFLQQYQEEIKARQYQEEIEAFLQQYPGKIAIINNADINAVRDEIARFKHIFENELNNSRSIIYAEAEAVLWESEEIAAAESIRAHISAWAGWNYVLTKRCETLLGGGSVSDEQNAIRAQLSVLASIGKDIASARLELATAMLTVSDRDEGTTNNKLESFMSEYKSIVDEYNQFISQYEKYIRAGFAVENWSEVEKQQFLSLFSKINQL